MNPCIKLSVALFSCALFAACLQTPTEPGNQEPPIPFEDRTGVLIIPEGTVIAPTSLHIFSLAESADINADSSFTVKSTAADKFQLLLFLDKSTNKPVFIGIYDPQSGKVAASDTSTALALTLFNPMLVYASQENCMQYLDAVRQNPKFQQLLQLLRAAYQSDPTNALDYDQNPLIYQTVVQIMKEVLQGFGAQDLRRPPNRLQATGEAPGIEDRDGDEIAFVNPRHVWYAAGIYNKDGSKKGVQTVKRKVSILSFQLGWPPVVISQPEATRYALGDGEFKIYIAKGFDFTRFTQWEDPVGRATILNSGQTILYLMEMFIGKFVELDISQLPNHFHISTEQAAHLALDLAQNNPMGFLTHFLSLMASNSEELAFWIFQEFQTNATHQFINTCATVFTKVTKVLELLGYVNEQGPFFYDLAFAPRDVTYFLTQSDGTIQSTMRNEAPVAEFKISPPAGIVGTVFTFDASPTTDDHDSLGTLQFRWDWESDGTWDTEWDTSDKKNHTYTESNAYAVTLEVRDSQDARGLGTHTVNVGGGAGTANHVKVFRDDLPWDSSALENTLTSLGFTSGTGPDTYEIIQSDQMATAPLIPGEDLVIIANDQSQNFYNNYARSQVRFTSFVFNGGALFWEACDEGWHNGSMAEAGVILPGNLVTDFDYDNLNYVTDQNLPLVAGLPNQMDHNYASHESFTSLPDGATIYCVNEESEPTLVEFNLGLGWVIITGQPLEHQYDRVYGSPDMEQLLPRIVAYFTGKTVTTPLFKRRQLPLAIRPTHLRRTD